MSADLLESRGRVLRRGRETGRCVLHWMSRDQRVEDNPSLELAARGADRLGLPLLSCFCLAPEFLGATARQYGFMLRGLEEVERGLVAQGIGFRLMLGDPGSRVPELLAEEEPALVVSDFDPLRPKREWRARALAGAGMTVVEADAHNIVPCWLASPKREYSAATLRPKLRRLLPAYLVGPSPAPRPKKAWREGPDTDWRAARASLRADRSVGEVGWARPGERAASQALAGFVQGRLAGYAQARNDPNREAQSGLSPYLHFGQLSPRRAAWEAGRSLAPALDREAFLEELIVRHELSDNFCHYALDYDTAGAFQEWARASLDQHRFDRREHLYAEGELERARTHDPLWNAAQTEMVRRGRMHGYLRMYWAKKILEWTEGPEEALRIAIRLNDRYELDGRDPNGYAGIAWSIGGVHDRAWPSRPVFGKVRYMSLSGARSKFDVDAYVARVAAVPG